MHYDDNDQDHGAIVSTVTITRRYYPDRDDPDERDVISVESSDSLSLLDTLGLLEFAKLSTAAGMLGDRAG